MSALEKQTERAVTSDTDTIRIALNLLATINRKYDSASTEVRKFIDDCLKEAQES